MQLDRVESPLNTKKPIVWITTQLRSEKTLWHMKLQEALFGPSFWGDSGTAFCHICKDMYQQLLDEP